MADKALRYNEGKAELSYLLDFNRALSAVAAVSQQGAIKYERGNWKKGGKPDTEYIDSALRHLVAHANEGYYDKDIGTLHIANAAWNLLALLELNITAAIEDEEGRGRSGMPVLDPEFDQEAFKARYAKAEGLLPNDFLDKLRADISKSTDGAKLFAPPGLITGPRYRGDHTYDSEEGVGC